MSKTGLFQNVKKRVSIILTLCFVLTNLLNMTAKAALSVSADDTANKIIGADATMEYSVDQEVTWTPYDTVNEPVFTGDQTISVRTAAYDSNPAGDSVILTFTADPVTPAAPAVTADDTANKIVGAAASMEYSVDNGTTWTAYSAETEPVFAGDQTVMVRVAAEGINPPGPATTLTFTMDPVTPSAPAVTADDTANKIAGAAATMEYSVDNGTTWTAYNTETEPVFAGDQSVLVRVAAEGINPAGPATTLTFTEEFVIVVNSAPVITDVTLSGTGKLGSTVTAAYVYSDAEQDAEGVSLIKWYRADNADGLNKTVISSATGLSYKITRDDQGKALIFEISPVAVTGSATGVAASESFTVAPNVKPVITKITLSGTARVGEKLTASYIYQDADHDAQGASVIKWFAADNEGGKNKKLIAGATGLTYTLTQNEQGKVIFVEVTPKAKTGVLTGIAKTAKTSPVKKIVYSSHIKLGVVGSKKYADSINNSIKKNNQFVSTTVKKEGSYYRVYADFLNKADSEKAMKMLKQKGFIKNYSYIG